MQALSDGGMSAMVTWQAMRWMRAQAPYMKIVDVDYALDLLIPERMATAYTARYPPAEC